ncbi:SMC-Scp complex subunit ScpB [Candidatus Woesearchaeota archaeon]|nr:SMC-Scp complex subunit ScpB [Candidatus Woesearchaeota archaeon]
MPKEQPSHKHNVEAVLFSTGRKMNVEEIAKLCRILREDALNALRELQADYNARNSSLMVIDEGDTWKLTIRERHLPVVKKIVAETELPKSVIETLAVIAWKAPVLQSDIIKVRTNKAYEHLKELEESGYITRQRKGRTNLIKLTQKFFQYFDLPPEKLQQMFKSITEMEQAILLKEQQLEQAKEQHHKQEEELKQQQETAKKMTETQIIDDSEVDLVDKQGNKTKLEVYDKQKEQQKEQPAASLETYEAEQSQQSEQTEEEPQQIPAAQTRQETALQAPDELVDKRVQELLHPEQEQKEEPEEAPELEQIDEEQLEGNEEEKDEEEKQ